MSAADGSERGERIPPDGNAWRDGQQQLAARNEETRRAGKQQRAAHERQIAELRRAERHKGEIFR